METDPVKAKLGKALRDVRRARGVQGTELARRLGKQPAQIYRWERGEAAAGIDQVYRYLEALGASFHDLEREVKLAKQGPSSPRLREIVAELEALARSAAGRRRTRVKRRP